MALMLLIRSSTRKKVGEIVLWIRILFNSSGNKPVLEQPTEWEQDHDKEEIQKIDAMRRLLGELRQKLSSTNVNMHA